MSLEINYDKQPLNFLRKLPAHISTRLVTKINQVFTVKTVPKDAKRVSGTNAAFRIRAGDYRILYRINHVDKKIVVFKIDKRARVYKR